MTGNLGRVTIGTINVRSHITSLLLIVNYLVEQRE